MKARAPGKVVLSGAYAVLEGAPAVVTAVSRYVTADSAREAEHVTPEVRAALGDGKAPWFDARELRGPRGKLGLGSSAAILVASLAALELDGGAPDDATLGPRVLDRALVAHRAAQGGGSGIDVAASAHGGTLIARRTDRGLELESVSLPHGLYVEVWSAGEPASTPELVSRVRALGARDATRYQEIMDALVDAATTAARAFVLGDLGLLFEALHAQRRGLARLGDAAGAPIVTPSVAKLGEHASRQSAVVLPSGAGGGDITLFVGPEPPSAELLALRDRLGHERLDLRLEARGVQCIRNGET